ncbi:MAG: hypothetical protein JRM98_05415 [Nitrososphaerota archaeon]|nr:hypothetical protein [Nitrososphaerota archaeon]
MKHPQQLLYSAPFLIRHYFGARSRWWISRMYREARTLHLELSRGSWDGLAVEARDWKRYYLPPPSVRKDGLVVDIGARDGDTAFFFCFHGYRNLRLVEYDASLIPALKHNVDILRRAYGASIEIRNKPFGLEDLQGAAFLKLDCEGCEYDVDWRSSGIPYGMEVHVPRGTPLAPGQSNALGYERG